MTRLGILIGEDGITQWRPTPDYELVESSSVRGDGNRLSSKPDAFLYWIRKVQKSLGTLCIEKKASNQVAMSFCEGGRCYRVLIDDDGSQVYTFEKYTATVERYVKKRDLVPHLGSIV